MNRIINISILLVALLLNGAGIFRIIHNQTIIKNITLQEKALYEEFMTSQKQSIATLADNLKAPPPLQDAIIIDANTRPPVDDEMHSLLAKISSQEKILTESKTLAQKKQKEGLSMGIAGLLLILGIWFVYSSERRHRSSESTR